nr:MAG TPA: putative RNA 2'-phosphotransferase [Bacteriophage sp.]
MSDNKPITREEMYLAKLTGDYTVKVPEPITRKERYLYKLCTDGIGTNKEAIAEAVQTYLTGKGVGLNMDADGYVSLKAKENS